MTAIELDLAGVDDAPARTVVLVEDHDLLAESLAVALGPDGIGVVRPASLDPGSVLATVTETRPDVVLLDLALGDASALPMIAPIRATGARVLLCTGETDPIRLAECVEAGAAGIVAKSASFAELVASIHGAVDDGDVLPPCRRAELLDALRRHRAEEAERLAPFAALSAAEADVLAALLDGHVAEVIAAERVVSMATVRTQIRSILTKLGVNSQLAAVALARAAGWRPDHRS